MMAPERKELGRLAVTVALGLLCGGCSGINASHSVSPASFFLPGLLKHDPPPIEPERTTPQDTNLVLVARSR